jgi:hypothetical protein
MTDTTQTTQPRDEQGQFAAEPSPEPHPLEGFKEMPSAPEPEEKTFSSESHGLREAAQELQQHREAAQPPIERSYINTQSGERVPENQTIKIDRAAKDLAAKRAEETDAIEQAAVARLQQDVDRFRSEAAAAEQPTAPQPADLAPQPETSEPAPTNGVDPEVAKALQNPKIRQALEQQVAVAEQTRQAYAQAAQQFIQAQDVALLSNFPELRGANAQTLPAVLHAINSRDPGRAAQIVQHLQAAQQNIAVARQHQAAEAMRQQYAAAKDFEQFARAADNEYEDFANTRPEAKEVREKAIEVLTKEYGVDANTLAHLWNTVPAVRSSAFQRIAHAAIAYSLARNSIHKAPPNLPPVQRPGHADDFGDHRLDHAQELAKTFRSDPTPRNAAKVLAARRAAARGR